MQKYLVTHIFYTHDHSFPPSQTLFYHISFSWARNYTKFVSLFQWPSFSAEKFTVSRSSWWSWSSSWNHKDKRCCRSLKLTCYVALLFISSLSALLLLCFRSNYLCYFQHTRKWDDGYEISLCRKECYCWVVGWDLFFQ